MAKIFKHVTISDELIWPPVPTSTQECDLQTETVELTKDTSKDQWQAGFEQGFAEATLAAETVFAEQHATLNQLIEHIPKAIKDNRLDLTKDIADIVLTIVQAFFIHQQQDPKTLNQQITHILTQLNDQQNVELSLHPRDLALLQQGKLSIDLSMCQGLRIVTSDQLSLGGCFIKSDHGVFDASIENQINRLKQLLLQIQQEATNA